MQNMELLERIFKGRRALLKRQILEYALTEFLRTGIAATTIEMIRDQADTSIGAIYHHFKNKEGIIAALYIAALTDQSTQRLQALSQVQGIERGIQAVIQSYIDWVVAYPDFARFLYAAHYTVQSSDFKKELQQSNQQRNQELKQWLAQQADIGQLQAVPLELLMSLIIGPTESYCRSWLSGRVHASPKHYAAALAKSAWKSIQHFQESKTVKID
ncbi:MULTISPECIES: TetR/AcrR family transcriptional regulator [unclassified Acinetobacter]|uniref:TetR/AcrR family transcriptional regulator n=1 Tax=unclassified Acinetobacter TaxID=196816 RepID=UPI0015D10E18|nr:MULTISPECIES: TetR/AcrR family transcriptional regulator [unclassified Acinetobacter]UNW06792.1 TetR/AcrR family transcriptional regulator [Acinetobacter variabilis]